MKNKGGRPRRTDLYRKVNFHCSAQADANISFVLGNAHLFGLPTCMSRSDAIVLCVDQVAWMMREKDLGKNIQWKHDEH